MTRLHKKVKKLPQNPGVYLFLDKNKNVIYVGKAKNLKLRISSYFRLKNLGSKTNQMIKNALDIKWILVASEIEALLLEAKLIKSEKPKYNTILKDDKNHLFIKVTKDEIPQVTLTRREKPSQKVLLFGPFPSASTARRVLVTLRRIFPYCSHRRKPKSCLYIHLGLCPNPYQSEESIQKYKKNIKKIIMFLSGKQKKLTANLIGEMELLSKGQKYEEALKIKKQIEDLNYVSQQVKKPEEYLQNPNLIEDIRKETLKKAKDDLNLPKLPERIEGYDISNIGGKFATGSMAVFTNAAPDKSQYRKFKIKLENKPDDTAMIAEVLKRRFGNNWSKPDLIIIDGGRGQLNCALAAVKWANLEIPVISLAKRFDEIYTSTLKSPLKLEKGEPTLKLLQYLRDEAHRFALNYHRKLRASSLLNKK